MFLSFFFLIHLAVSEYCGINIVATEILESEELNELVG